MTITIRSRNKEKVLERLTEDKFEWQLHENSMIFGRLAVYIAEMFGWTQTVVTTTKLVILEGDWISRFIKYLTDFPIFPQTVLSKPSKNPARSKVRRAFCF